MGETSEQPPRLSRRQVLGGLAALVGGIVVGAGLPKILEIVEKFAKKSDPVYGKPLELDNKSGQPLVRHGRLVPVAGQKSIPIREEPQINAKIITELPETNQGEAIPMYKVGGGTYSSMDERGFRKKILDNGQSINYGDWYAVNLRGVDGQEKPGFVAANFVTLLPEKQEK